MYEYIAQTVLAPPLKNIFSTRCLANQEIIGILILSPIAFSSSDVKNY